MIEVIRMRDKGGYGKDKGLFIHMSKMDAIHLIHSLTAQMIANNPNIGRWEPRDNDGKEFTIAVIPEGE